MPNPPTQKEIGGNSLPLPPTWAETIPLKGYWERKDAEERKLRQLTACEREVVYVDDGLGDEFEAELDQWEAGRD